LQADQLGLLGQPKIAELNQGSIMIENDGPVWKVHNGAAERKGDTGMSIVAVDEGGQGPATEGAPRGDEASTATDFPRSRRCQPQTSQHAQPPKPVRLHRAASEPVRVVQPAGSVV
jgi:hypothetical protein